MHKLNVRNGGKKGESEYVFKSANDIIDYEENIKRLNKGEAIKYGSDSKKKLMHHLICLK